MDPSASLALVRAIAASRDGAAACTAFARRAVEDCGAASAAVWVAGEGDHVLAASAGGHPGPHASPHAVRLDLCLAGATLGRVLVTLDHPPDDSERALWETATIALAGSISQDRETTRRRAAERDTAALARVLDNIPAVIAVHRGPDLTFERINRAYRDATDGRPIVGRSYADAFPEFVEQGHKVVLDAIYTTGTPFRAAGVRADTPRQGGGPAEERYWNVDWFPTRDDDDHIDGVVTFAFEVTDEVVARQVAESARQQFDDLVRSVDALAWKVHPESWRVMWMSGPVDRVLGCSATEALDVARWWAPVHTDDREAVDLARATARAGGSYDVEFRVADRTTGWRWLAETGHHGGGDTVHPYVWGLTVDVTARRAMQTERERVQAQLLHMQKVDSLGLLAGGIAHDFNNLLTAILGNSSLASTMIPNEHAASSVLHSMVSAAQRASELTSQLLAYTGRGHFRVELVDANARIRELGALLGASLPKSVRLRLDLASRLPPVEADAAQLQQVLMNLVINGADAIGEDGGTVSVVTGVQDVDAGYARSIPGSPDVVLGQYVFVEVTDSGIGMSPDTIDRIFDPFFTTKSGGRGLGLAAVQGIVRGHKGVIRVYSELGRGTTFKVLLPAAASIEEAVAPTPPQSGVGVTATVLIVDDEPMVREVARSILEHGGHSVLEASDGFDGIAVFRAQAARIDLVLLDLTMPGMSGEEVFRELRRIRGDARVLLSSGYSEVEATCRLLGRGHAGFIQKPYTVSQLTEAVQSALGDER